MSPLLIAAFILSIPAVAPAAEPATPPPAPGALTPPPAKDAPVAVTLTAVPGKGLIATSEDGRLSVGLRARMQLRNTFTHSDDTDTNELQVRTLRLSVFGNVLAPEIRYTIQLAFGGGDFDSANPSPIFDAFLDFTHHRDLNVRVGQFFVPFDRARTIREFALQMVDRQIVVRELTLDRDVGVMLSSSDLFGFNELFGYHVFVGGGDGRNRFGALKPGAILVGRFVVRPFGNFDEDQEGDLSREQRPRLAIGLAGAWNQNTSRQNSTYGATFALGTTDYLNAALDVVFKYAGFSLLAEGLWRRASEDVLTGMVNGAPATEYTRSGYGYFVQAGMMVHENVEVTARWDQLFTRGGTDPTFAQLADTQGRQLGAGANLYLNGHAFKVQADYFYVFGTEGTPRHLARLQLDASF
ncbi:MAG TPA: porin [Myxococcaceae bacterium]|nr:porin [Myxococcaceae bacterium]